MRYLSNSGLGRIVVSMLIMVMAALSTSVYSKDNIVWGTIDAPPYAIPDGPDKNQGIVDQVRILLEQQLTGYEHTTLVTPFPRAVIEIKDGKHFCYPITTSRTEERLAFAYFSVPAWIATPPKVFVREDRRALFETSGTLSLDVLLANPALTSSYIRGRKYGNPTIDGLLERYPPSHFHAANTQGVKMLLAGRIDYLLEIPSVVRYTAQQIGEKDTLRALSFQGMGGPTLAYVMCPKTEWGRQVIQAIDAVLKVERRTKLYRLLMEKWRDADEVTAIRKFYDTGFLMSE